MRVWWQLQKDSAIYWQKTGVDDKSRSTFAEPIVIRCRWDIVQTDLQQQDVIDMEIPGNTVYPDRVLVIDSFLMLGNQEMLDNLSPEDKKDPKNIREARLIKSQSTVAELGWEQTEYPPGFSHPKVIVQVQV